MSEERKRRAKEFLEYVEQSGVSQEKIDRLKAVLVESHMLPMTEHPDYPFK